MEQHDRKKGLRAIEYFEPFSVPEFGYPSIESQDFEKSKNEARRMIQELDLGIQSGVAFDKLVKLEALNLFFQKIVALRLENHRVTTGIRSSMELKLANQSAYALELSDTISSIDNELQELGWSVQYKKEEERNGNWHES